MSETKVKDYQRQRTQVIRSIEFSAMKVGDLLAIVEEYNRWAK